MVHACRSVLALSLSLFSPTLCTSIFTCCYFLIATPSLSLCVCAQAPVLTLEIVGDTPEMPVDATTATVPINGVNPAFANPSVDGVTKLNGAPEPVCAKPFTRDPGHDATYFATQANEQRQYLSASATRWAGVLETGTEAGQFDEDTLGNLNRAVGQARLLMKKRLAQFERMCVLEQTKQSCKGGLFTRDADLEGFWEVIMMQIEDIRAMFEGFQKREAIGWAVEEKTVECLAPKKKKRKVNPSVHRLRKQARPGPVTPRRRAAKDRLAAMKKKFKKSTFTTKDVELVDAHSSISVLTPMKASKRDRELLGTDVVITPARRSTRKTPSKYRRDECSDDISALLSKSDYAYKPNAAMSMMPSPAHFSAGRTTGASASVKRTPLQLPSLGEVDEASLTPAGNEAEDPLSKFLFGDDAAAEQPAHAPSLPPLFELASQGSKLISLTPDGTPVSRSNGQAAFEIASKLGGLGGSSVRFAAATPLRQSAGVQFGANDAVFTPVRRSSRIERIQTPHQRQNQSANGFSFLN